MINFKKKPNAPHEDFLILGIIWRDVFFFFCNHREREREIQVDLKTLIYHQTTKSL